MSAAEDRINELLRAARRQVESGDREQALKTLRKALDINPGNATIRDEIQSIEREIAAISAFRRTRTQRSHAPAETLVASTGESFVEECIRRAQEAVDSGDEIRALQELERARRQDPENTDIQKRIKIVKRAIKANNLSDLAFTRLRAGDPAGALEQARKIFEFWPASPALERLVTELEELEAPAPSEALPPEEPEEEVEEVGFDDLVAEERPPVPAAASVQAPAEVERAVSGEEAAVAEVRDLISRSAYSEALEAARAALAEYPGSGVLAELKGRLEKVAVPSEPQAAPVAAAPVAKPVRQPKPAKEPRPQKVREPEEREAAEAVPAGGRRKPPLGLLIGVGAFIVLAVIGIIVFGGRKPSVPETPEIVPFSAALTIQGPEGMAVNLDGQPFAPDSDGVYRISGTDFGTRQLELRAQGYEVMLVPLELAEGQNIQQTLAMQPLGTGTTDITFDILMPEGEPQPAEGAVSVLVDGTPVQSLAASVPTGLHVFQAELEGYNSLPETVLVDVPGAFSQQLALLSPETSQISLTLAGDIPGTAVFYVDGVQVTTGRRLTHIADRGSHTVRVTMEGRDDWSRTIDLGPDGFSQTVVLEETVTTGRLLIGPEPWADVTINGTGYGQTPMPPIELEPGSYTVRLSNPDYEDQIQTVTITLGEDTSIRYTAEQRAPDQPEIIEEQPVIPPFPTQQVSPQVPGLAAERGDIHGYVTLEVRVGTDGSVLGVSVTNDPLGLGCGQAAADAVSQWRFQPATQGGVPVEVTTAVQVRFDIQ